MRPTQTKNTTAIFRLPGGTEENNLAVEYKVGEGGERVMASVWTLSDDERAKIAAGGMVELMVWGAGHPPVALAVITSDDD